MARRWRSPVSITPRSYQRITLVALFLLAFIVVTGGAVRLAGSGLGCPDWPTCAKGSVVAPLEWHAWVEFGNRLVTGLVSIIVILAVLGSLVRTPRRRDLTLLSVGLVAGVLAQIVLGGLVVLFDLAPPLVMAHFSLSMVIVLDAVVLHHRARLPDGPAVSRSAGPLGPRVALVDRDQLRMVRLLAVMAGLVIFLGTVTTASGPHPGSNGDQVVDRLPFSLHDAARVHGIAVMLFLAFTVLTIWSLWRGRAPQEVMQRAELLLTVLVAQAAIGYIQYFSRLPVVLVGIHIAGATAVWMATVWLNCGVHAPAAERAREPTLVAA